MVNENQRADFDWFNSNVDEFFKKYGRCYLVIKDKKIIGRYESFEKAYVDMEEKKEPMGTFIIQECTDDPNRNTNTVVTVGLDVI